MEEDQWFDAIGELGEAEHTFAAALRARAAAWDPVHTEINPAAHGYPMIAWLDILAPRANVRLLTVGVHFEGDRIRGDQLHNQCFTLPDQPTDLAPHETPATSGLVQRTPADLASPDVHSIFLAAPNSMRSLAACSR